MDNFEIFDLATEETVILLIQKSQIALEVLISMLKFSTKIIQISHSFGQME